MAQSNPDTHLQEIDQFIQYWGRMASAWGINRTMAQIHALLFAESEPLDTDAIMERLGVSRGNANMNLRNLIQWNLIHKVHFKGHRKDYYTAEKNVWEIVATIIKERQQREITPIIQELDQLLSKLESKQDPGPEEAEFKDKIEEFLTFLVMFNRFTDAILPFINKQNLGFLKKFVKLAEMRNKMQRDPEQYLNFPDESGR